MAVEARVVNPPLAIIAALKITVGAWVEEVVDYYCLRIAANGIYNQCYSYPRKCVDTVIITISGRYSGKIMAETEIYLPERNGAMRNYS